MTQEEFERLLDSASAILREEARSQAFDSAKAFENRVRNIFHESSKSYGFEVNLDPHPQAFPDIAIGRFGVEVKFTTNDTWRSIANSILESQRLLEVERIYLIFGKMGGEVDVRWADYEKSVIHVRTSHVPRFEVEIGSERSLFERMGVTYEHFRLSEMADKMRFIRNYARGRLRPGERLWWLEDSPGETHTLPIQVRLYTRLSPEEKVRLRAESILLCHSIVKSGRSRDKYDDVVLYLLTYHGVLCHQARDLFSAGSVANPMNDDQGGVYIQRAIKLIEDEIQAAALRMDDELFYEYWGEHVRRENRIKEWLVRADKYATGWTPSLELFNDTLKPT